MDWLDKHNNVKGEYLGSLANGLAIGFANEKPKLTKHQLRAFYEFSKRLEKAITDASQAERLLPQFQKLIPQAHAREKRGKIPASFNSFLKRGVEGSRDYKQFKGFIGFFEAVVAFGEGRLEDKD